MKRFVNSGPVVGRVVTTVSSGTIVPVALRRLERRDVGVDPDGASHLAGRVEQWGRAGEQVHHAPVVEHHVDLEIVHLAAAARGDLHRQLVAGDLGAVTHADVGQLFALFGLANLVIAKRSLMDLNARGVS